MDVNTPGSRPWWLRSVTVLLEILDITSDFWIQRLMANYRSMAAHRTVIIKSRQNLAFLGAWKSVV